MPYFLAGERMMVIFFFARSKLFWYIGDILVIDLNMPPHRRWWRYKLTWNIAGHAHGRAMKKTGSPNFSGSLQVLSNSLLKNCIKLRFYHKCKHNERIVLLFINMHGAWSLVDSTCSRILKSSSISSHYYFPPIFFNISRALIYISCTHIFIIHPIFWITTTQ